MTTFPSSPIPDRRAFLLEAAAMQTRGRRTPQSVHDAINAFDGTAATLAAVMRAFVHIGADPHSTVATSTGMAPRSIWASVADAPTVAAALHAHDFDRS